MPKITGILAAAAFFGAPSLAYAHLGHIGELAGHSHWAGVAAIAGAAIVAGIVAIKDKKARDKQEAAAGDAPEATDEGEAEAAQ